MNINNYIDHTLLKPEATINQIKKLCQEAIEYEFKSVCVNPFHVQKASSLLKDSNVVVCTVIGFPLGSNDSKTKAFESALAIQQGASEIDMVINIGALKDKNYELVESDINKVIESANGAIVKVIIETALLSDEEIIKVTKIVSKTKANFIKTSTGFSTRGASLNDIKLINKHKRSDLLIKASGGIKNLEDAKLMIENNVSRIGTSNGINIIKGNQAKGY